MSCVSSIEIPCLAEFAHCSYVAIGERLTAGLCSRTPTSKSFSINPKYQFIELHLFFIRREKARTAPIVFCVEDETRLPTSNTTTIDNSI